MSYVTFTDDKAVTPSRAIVTNVVVRGSADSVVNVCDGTQPGSDPVVLPLAVKSGDTVSVSGRFAFNTGVYVDVVSGTVVGTVFYE
jgi:predicted TIM-barrel enzyme